MSEGPRDYNIRDGRHERQDLEAGGMVRKVIAKNFQMTLDERGIPVDLNENGTAAPHCPIRPCGLCTGFSQLFNDDGTAQTSWEWCQMMDTCAATVDWEKVFGR